MSEALERVIAEQQAEIDRLRADAEHDQKQAIQRHVERVALLELLAPGIVGTITRPLLKPDSPKFGEWRHEVRMWMLNEGWCVQCDDFDPFQDCMRD